MTPSRSPPRCWRTFPRCRPRARIPTTWRVCWPSTASGRSTGRRGCGWTPRRSGWGRRAGRSASRSRSSRRCWPPCTAPTCAAESFLAGSFLAGSFLAGSFLAGTFLAGLDRDDRRNLAQPLREERRLVRPQRDRAGDRAVGDAVLDVGDELVHLVAAGHERRADAEDADHATGGDDFVPAVQPGLPVAGTAGSTVVRKVIQNGHRRLLGGSGKRTRARSRGRGCAVEDRPARRDSGSADARGYEKKNARRAHVI